MSACVLKLIAAAAMLCDHTAVTLYPLWLGKAGYELLRGIGRVAAVTSALSKTIVYRGEGFPALFPRIAGKTQTRRCRFS